MVREKVVRARIADLLKIGKDDAERHGGQFVHESELLLAPFDETLELGFFGYPYRFRPPGLWPKPSEVMGQEAIAPPGFTKFAI
jgi:hypothetical protein